MPDFRLEDVWALPTPGSAADFPALVDAFATGDPAQRAPGPARLLWAIRFKLGELFGWDEADHGLGSRVESLRERLPQDLLDAPRGPEFETLPFRPLYMLEDEFAGEIANHTVHGVVHLGWVRDGDSFRGQLAVLVRPNGLLGEAYMLGIRPFRHTVIYPPMLRQLEREWASR